MYERMLDKQNIPSIADMTAYCGDTAELFASLNRWLSDTFDTSQEMIFPYGNHYGWGISHKKKKKLICNVFAEENAFTVMLRLPDKQYSLLYPQLQKYTQEYIDTKYLCGDGGWIHYRVKCKEHFDDIRTLLSAKFS